MSPEKKKPQKQKKQPKQKKDKRENIDLQGIGQRAKAIRLQLGLTQKDFGLECDVSTGTISELEAGNGVPRHNVIYNLYTKHNVNIDYLLHNRGEMYIVNAIERRIDNGEFGEYTGFFKRFWQNLNDSTVLRFEMMNFFRRYRITNHKVIEEDIHFDEKLAGERRGPQSLPTSGP